jgi:VanZ family protein
MSIFLNLLKSFWIPCTIVLLTAITVLSLLPLDSLPPAPGNDKMQHFVSYACLALPAALRKPRGWIVLCLLFVGYSGLIEIIQPYVNRYCDIRDLLANATGVLCGVIVAKMATIFSGAGK